MLKTSGRMIRNSDDLDLPRDGSTDYLIGLRFDDINIPKGAEIIKAYVQFTADENDDEPTTLLIYGEDTDDAATISSLAYNLSSRKKTATYVRWTPAPGLKGIKGWHSELLI